MQHEGGAGCTIGERQRGSLGNDGGHFVVVLRILSIRMYVCGLRWARGRGGYGINKGRNFSLVFSIFGGVRLDPFSVCFFRVSFAAFAVLDSSLDYLPSPAPPPAPPISALFSWRSFSVSILACRWPHGWKAFPLPISVFGLPNTCEKRERMEWDSGGEGGLNFWLWLVCLYTLAILFRSPSPPPSAHIRLLSLHGFCSLGSRCLPLEFPQTGNFHTPGRLG